MTTDQTAEPRHSVHFRRAHGERPVFTVDGVDLTREISGIQIVSDAVAGTRVSVEVPPHRLQDVEFEGLAVVELNTYTDDPGPAAAVFLGAMDAETLEKHALQRLDLDNEPHGTTRAILRTLIEWANGEGTM